MTHPKPVSSRGLALIAAVALIGPAIAGNLLAAGAMPGAAPWAAPLAGAAQAQEAPPASPRHEDGGAPPAARPPAVPPASAPPAQHPPAQHPSAEAARTGADAAFADAMEKMHHGMMIAPTGDPDVDFVRAMIPHHQGAVDMAKAELAFGRDPELRRLSEAIIAAQEKEIGTMREWLARKAPGIAEADGAKAKMMTGAPQTDAAPAGKPKN